MRGGMRSGEEEGYMESELYLPHAHALLRHAHRAAHAAARARRHASRASPARMVVA